MRLIQGTVGRVVSMDGSPQPRERRRRTLMLKATQLENDRGRTGTRQPQLGTLLLIRGLYSDRCPESGHPTPHPRGCIQPGCTSHPSGSSESFDLVQIPGVASGGRRFLSSWVISLCSHIGDPELQGTRSRLSSQAGQDCRRAVQVAARHPGDGCPRVVSCPLQGIPEQARPHSGQGN